MPELPVQHVGKPLRGPIIWLLKQRTVNFVPVQFAACQCKKRCQDWIVFLRIAPVFRQRLRAVHAMRQTNRNQRNSQRHDCEDKVKWFGHDISNRLFKPFGQHFDGQP